MVKGGMAEIVTGYSSGHPMRECCCGIKKTRHEDAFKEQKVHDIAGIARVTVS